MPEFVNEQRSVSGHFESSWKAPPQRPGSNGRDGDLTGEDRCVSRTPRALLGSRTGRDWDSPVRDGSSTERRELRLHSRSRYRRARPPPASPPTRGWGSREDAAGSEPGSSSYQAPRLTDTRNRGAILDFGDRHGEK
ncbi:hypothetical protein NDU88_005456 [Pleurodeles waltl]|uniref:Uncharacterized protein n=1 Tax=Pleurodeles waltl TaxID=8319 RepID=A0AAV7MJF9_PLEWA|nr:hypothetical protein NDU88_005456 [Pleurodeles waltl]